MHFVRPSAELLFESAAAAVKTGEVDFVLPLADIAPALQTLAKAK